MHRSNKRIIAFVVASCGAGVMLVLTSLTNEGIAVSAVTGAQSGVLGMAIGYLVAWPILALIPTTAHMESDDQVDQIVRKSKKPAVARVLATTQRAWCAGALDFTSDIHRKEAVKNNLRTFVQNFSAQTPTLAAAIRERAIEDEEYIVGVSDNNFVLTDRALYLFERGILKGPIRVFLLAEVLEYSADPVVLTNNSGDAQHFPQVRYMPDPEVFAHFQQAARLAESGMPS